MSEFERLKRITKSILPSLTSRRTLFYNFEDAKMMIVDLALAIPAELLAKILSETSHLDDFLSGIYQVEDNIGKRIITENMTIDKQFQPKVYIDGQKICFTVTLQKLLSAEEVVFAEYNFGESLYMDVSIE